MSFGSIFGGVFGASDAPIAPPVTNIGDQQTIESYQRQLAQIEARRLQNAATNYPFPVIEKHQGKIITHLDKMLESIAKADDTEAAMKELVKFAKEHTARRVAEELAQKESQAQTTAPMRANLPHKIY